MSTATDTDAVLVCTNLVKSYPTSEGALTVLKGVSLTLRLGETCAVVGPSGSGKTTLLALAAGLDRPSTGDVVLAGADLSRLSEDAIAAHRNRFAGFVFQNFQLVPTLTALENVQLPLELLGGQSQREVRERATDLLRQVGMTHRLGHFPLQLSGGEQQRVALARAFVNEPQILFADEPTGNLDGENAKRAWELMERLNAERQTAILLVTHDEALARRMQRTIRLQHGEVSRE